MSRRPDGWIGWTTTGCVALLAVIYSEEIVHPPIISDDTFQQAQQLLGAKGARRVVRRPRSSPRPSVLRGLLFCGICDRRMQGSWNNGQPYYRCMFPGEYALADRIHHPRTVYLREAEVVPELDTWLTKTLDPAHLPGTIDTLTAAQNDDPPPEMINIREEIGQCKRQIAQYRAVLDAGTDPTIVGQWIIETQARKLAAEGRLRLHAGIRHVSPGQMSKEEITTIVNAVTSLITVLRDADPQDKAEIYSQLGLRLTYHPSPRTVSARAEPRRPCTKGWCPRGVRGASRRLRTSPPSSVSWCSEAISTRAE
jgi:site-specific DNA recombinase